MGTLSWVILWVIEQGRNFSFSHANTHNDTNTLTQKHTPQTYGRYHREREHDRKIEQDDRLSHWFTADHKFSARINSCEFLTHKHCPVCVCVCQWSWWVHMDHEYTSFLQFFFLDFDGCLNLQVVVSVVCVGKFMIFLHYRENVIQMLYFSILRRHIHSHWKNKSLYTQRQNIIKTWNWWETN